MDAVRASGYTTVVLWTIHVNSNGDLVFDSPLLVSGGAYVGASTWPAQLATLKQAPTTVNRVEVCVGSAGPNDFGVIKTLIAAQGTGSGSILYKNFQALKTATGADAIDFDDEQEYDVTSMVQFAQMLSGLGYKVTLCPYQNQSFWQTVKSQLGSIVDRVYLQCYSGGAGNNPATWNTLFGGLKVMPGLDTTGTPAQVQTQMSSWESAAGVPGGFMWNYDAMTTANMPLYAEAILSAPTGYTYGVAENNTQNYSTPVDVAYGAGSGYNYKYALTGNVTYNNTTFTPDPAPGLVKAGYYKVFPQAASENGSFTFSVPVEAAFGANSTFYYNQGISGTVTFSNAVWGDPIPNVAKAGYYMPYTACAGENDSCTFTTPTNVAFGANGKYSFMYGVTGTITFNTATFGDPNFGVAKTGYFRPTSVTPTFGLANASFETPSVGAANFQYNPTGGSWTFSGNSGIQSNGSAWGAPTAPNGTQTAFLQCLTGSTNGSISETVSFNTAGTYELTFQSALRGIFSPGTISFNILVDNVVVGTCAPTNTTSFTSYATNPFVINTAGNHTVTFTAVGTNSSVFIDAVGIY